MKHFGESLVYTLINVVGSFITILFTIGVSFISEDRVLTKKEIFGKGEIIIICVPLCISVIYSLFNNKKQSGSFNWNSIFFWLTLVLILFSTWFYSKFSGDNLKYNNNLYWFSLIMFMWTTITMFFSKIVETPNVDLKKDRSENLIDLMKKMEQLKH